MKLTDERFNELRELITIKDVLLKDAPTNDIYLEWQGGMYLDSAEGLSSEQMERLLAVEQELTNRDPAKQHDTTTQ